MKVIRVIDDGECILTTFDELAALRALEKLNRKHDVTSCWIDIEEVK
jgi:hypothetical protein